MFKNLCLFLAVTAVSVVILTITIHTRWLLFTTAGGIIVAAWICISSSPSGTGYVLDNLVSFVILCIVAVLLALSVQNSLDRSASPHKSTENTVLTPKKALERVPVGHGSSAFAADTIGPACLILSR